MLNRKIANVRHQLQVAIAEGLTLTPSLMRNMHNILVSAEAEANLLLGAQVPSRQRLTGADLADGKVVMFPHIPTPAFRPVLPEDCA